MAGKVVETAPGCPTQDKGVEINEFDSFANSTDHVLDEHVETVVEREEKSETIAEGFKWLKITLQR